MTIKSRLYKLEQTLKKRNRKNSGIYVAWENPETGIATVMYGPEVIFTGTHTEAKIWMDTIGSECLIVKFEGDSEWAQ